MNTKNNVSFFLVATALLLASAPPAHAANDYDVRKRLDTLEQDVRSLRSTGAGPAGEARLGVRISEIEDDIRRVRGLVEENQYRNDQLAKELNALRQDVQVRLQELEQNAPIAGMPPAPGASGGVNVGASMPPPPSVAPAAPAGGGRSMEDVVNEVTVGTRPETPAAPTNLPAMKFGSAQEHYSHAFTLINRAQYDEAERVLRAFVQQYQGDKLSGNAYYWLGETYYVRDKYLEAADAFRQGFEALPDGQKAPDNLLKLGMSLGKLNKKDQACVVLKQLQVKYQGKAQPVLERAAREAQTLSCT